MKMNFSLFYYNEEHDHSKEKAVKDLNLASYLRWSAMYQKEEKELNKEKAVDKEPKTECSNDYNCSCDDCQSKYGSLPLLLKVIEEKTNVKSEPQPSTSSGVTRTPAKKILVCQYCSKTFSHRGDYNKHLRKHTKEQPFSCSICNRKFSHTSNLQRHVRLHSGQKPYVCRTCGRGFSRKDKLESHKRSKTCQKMSQS